MFLRIAHAVRYQTNEAFATFIYVASGKDLKQFLKVKFWYSINFVHDVWAQNLSIKIFYVGDCRLVGCFCNWQLVQFLDTLLYWSVPFISRSHHHG